MLVGKPALATWAMPGVPDPLFVELQTGHIDFHNTVHEHAIRVEWRNEG